MRSRRFSFASDSHDALEARDLLSVVPVLYAHAARVHASTSTAEPPTDSPTSHEIRREAFQAKLSGTYTTGPGRFTDEALRTSFSVSGTSNQFLHGSALVALTNYSDPTRPSTGVAAIYPKNTQSTGSVLLLDLVGTPSADSSKPPTHFTWTINGNAGGLYFNATGQGTLDIVYLSATQGRGRALKTGRAGLVFAGQINTTSIGNILRFAR